ncbi:hypothetical protein J1614_011572 [Plenodomus biglobosus]|nr:hypothetical protein J1614_011572 [Plenodomus biglobosus]
MGDILCHDEDLTTLCSFYKTSFPDCFERLSIAPCARDQGNNTDDVFIAPGDRAWHVLPLGTLANAAQPHQF